MESPRAVSARERMAEGALRERLRAVGVWVMRRLVLVLEVVRLT